MDGDSFFHQILEKRYSGRKYRSTPAISDREILQLIRAAHLAPSSYNAQPWRFILCNIHTDPKAHHRLLSTLHPTNQEWAQNAPLLILVMHQSIHREKSNPYSLYDTASAAFAMMLQATAMGLMSHQMGGFDKEKSKSLFALQESIIPIAVMAIGHPIAESPPPRIRNCLETHFYLNDWDHPLQQPT